MTTPIAYLIETTDATGAVRDAYSWHPPTDDKLAAGGWEFTADRDGIRLYENDTHRMAVYPLFFVPVSLDERDEP